MKKTRKMVVWLLMVFGAVSVSFGVDIMDNKENYQKLKAEVEAAGKMLYDSGMTSAVVDDNYCNERKKYNSDIESLCKSINVVVFFDEISVSNAEIKNPKGLEKLINLKNALLKVGEMPRFKEDSGIYSYVKFVRNGSDAMSLGGKFGGNFWEEVFEDWKRTKTNLGISKAISEVWKQAGEIGRIE